MKSILRIITILLIAKNLQSQQVVMFSHYYYKPMLYNPAFTGTSGAPEIMIVNHTQWAGFKNAPQYNILTADANLINQNTGLGVSIISDKKGITNRIGGNIMYSYKLKFNKTSHLLLGLSAGVIDQTMNLSNAIVENQNDPYLFSNSQRNTSFDANAGLALIIKGFEFGFSVPQLANNKLSYVSNNDSRTYYTQARHYITSAKYKFLLSKEKQMSITPLALVRYVPNSPTQYDINMNFNWENKFWIGATYKSNYAVGANAGVTLFNKLNIGYSYDFITGNVSKYAGISHEIMLSFKFVKHKEEPVVIDTTQKMTTQQQLNKLIIDQILKKIENLLDRGDATPLEIQALLDEISAFLDSESMDPMQETLNKYYKSLKQAQGDLNVLVKGKIVIEGNENANDFSGITITVIDLGTHQIVATCSPTSSTGKYFIILKPGRKYHLIAESKNHSAYSKYFSPDGSVESYEMSQEIILKKP